jgi:hypothetical protein
VFGYVPTDIQMSTLTVKHNTFNGIAIACSNDASQQYVGRGTWDLPGRLGNGRAIPLASEVGCTPVVDQGSQLTVRSGARLDMPGIDVRGNLLLQGATLLYNSFYSPGGGPINFGPTFAVVNSGWKRGAPSLDATHNFWGAYDPVHNPRGNGSAVGVGVLYRPWLGLSLSRSNGHPKPRIGAAGTGYGKKEAVEIEWNCSSLTCGAGSPIGTVTTSSSGSFSTTVSIPPGKAGKTYWIGAIGASSRAFTRSTFKVT